MQESPFFQRAGDGRLRCTLCPHGCTLGPGDRGVCGVRANLEGRLVSLVRDRVAAIHSDPVEKKPLYHCLPGTHTLSYATVGCNLVCRFCQNHSLSQCRSEPLPGSPVEPAAMVAMARSQGCPSITATYTEPTVFFDLAREVGDLARQEGLRNLWVSNGFTGPAVLEELPRWLDAINVDLKSMRDETYRTWCGGSLGPVLTTIEELAAAGVWVEVTTLLVPGLNDSDREVADMARFLHGLAPHLPWHISAFHPDHRMIDRPCTDPAALVRAGTIGREAGLHHVYLGNVRLPGWSDTRCAGCGRVLIERSVGVRSHLDPGGSCPDCGRTLPGLLS